MATADILRDDMKAIEDIVSAYIHEVGDGEVEGMGRYGSGELAMAAQSQVQSIMRGLAEFMTGPPDSRIGNVI